MAKSDSKFLERDLNRLIAEEMREAGFLVLQEVRLNPCEMDIVLFDPQTLRLATLEIKRANWRAVLAQAIRAKLYCHFATAILPASLKETAPIGEFTSRGIGLIFYYESGNKLELALMCKPSVSDSINRSFKQLVYREFHEQYGEEVYA